MTWIVAGIVVIALVILLSRGSASFSASRSVEDFEARLRPVGEAAGVRNAWGKVERERFADGSEEVEASLRRLELPDGTRLELLVAGRPAGFLTVEGGRARLERRSSEPGEIPRVEAGDPVEVRRGGELLLRGAFRPD